MAGRAFGTRGDKDSGLSVERGWLRPRQEAVDGEKPPLQEEGSGRAGGLLEVVSGLQVVTEGEVMSISEEGMRRERGEDGGQRRGLGPQH